MEEQWSSAINLLTVGIRYWSKSGIFCSVW